MGQCYSVNFKAKLKDADAFVRLTREFATARGWDSFSLGKLSGVGNVIKYMITGSVPYITVKREDGWTVFQSWFDGSYSWDSVMENWFGAVAPSLKDGSEIEVAPDEGLWKCVVRDGAASDREYDDD